MSDAVLEKKEWEYLTKSFARVTLASLLEPTNILFALLNPEQLRISLSVAIGKLHPVGSSHPTLMYGYTDGAELPLDFYFSTQLSKRIRGQVFELAEYSSWFSSFCYPTEPGSAPKLLYMVWPNILEMALVVERFSAEFIRFAGATLSPQALKISITALEYRRTFKDADTQMDKGFRGLDPVLSGYRATGSPLRFGK